MAGKYLNRGRIAFFIYQIPVIILLLFFQRIFLAVGYEPEVAYEA
jgi:ABC-type glycerol-3-phosphate transport system permease component